MIQPVTPATEVSASRENFHDAESTNEPIYGEAGPVRVLAAFDKFRHTATAAQLCGVVGDVAWERGWHFAARPVADGGEGTLDVLAENGGQRITTRVQGPLGETVHAEWLLRGTTAFIEMARASGLPLVGGKDGNRALDASTFGTGELCVAALRHGAKKLVIGLGGSATTDGGLGALQAMAPLVQFRGVDLLVACDVETTFVDAARVFGPQKGASSAQVELLTRRLDQLAAVYERERGVDVRLVIGSGAAGGLAGALVSIGARLRSGFSLVADEVGLEEAMGDCNVVVTGEGFLDTESFNGKAVGGVVELANRLGRPVVIVCGGREEHLVLPPKFEQTIRSVIVLSDRFGRDRSWNETLPCIRSLGVELLGPQFPPGTDQNQ